MPSLLLLGTASEHNRGFLARSRQCKEDDCPRPFTRHPTNHCPPCQPQPLKRLTITARICSRKGTGRTSELRVSFRSSRAPFAFCLSAVSQSVEYTVTRLIPRATRCKTPRLQPLDLLVRWACRTPSQIYQRLLPLPPPPPSTSTMLTR